MFPSAHPSGTPFRHSIFEKVPKRCSLVPLPEGHRFGTAGRWRQYTAFRRRQHTALLGRQYAAFGRRRHIDSDAGPAVHRIYEIQVSSHISLNCPCIFLQWVRKQLLQAPRPAVAILHRPKHLVRKGHADDQNHNFKRVDLAETSP